MIKKCENNEMLTFKVAPPLYLPFQYSDPETVGGKSDLPYTYYKPFDFDPFTVWTFATCGSPVVLSERFFVGFLNESGGRFAFDGAGTLTVYANAGQEVYYNVGGDPFASWEDYNAIILARRAEYKPQEFWSDIEYCTWVEQKHSAEALGVPNQETITEDFVYRFMDRIEALGLPKGKLTIDDGWDTVTDESGRRILGNWDVDRKKFPNFEKLVLDMRSRGFKPGLWLAPFIMTNTCRLAQKRPDLIGHTWSYDPIAEGERGYCFIEDDDCLDEYYYEIFSKYIKMGFQKFKLDFSYGPKQKMKALLKRIYRIIKSIDESVEVECHLPDIFLSQYADTVRLNDVLFDADGKWRYITVEHYRVCKYSSEKLLNLDHVGTNTPTPRAEDYIEHARLVLSLPGGYPCISLLPDNFDKNTENEFIQLVKSRVI